MDTITAIATPPGNGGVAIIRLSGDEALTIAAKVFKIFNNKIKPRYCYLGDLEIDGVVDEAICIYFKAPYSFTGEDVVEMQIHGGFYLANFIVSKLCELGARQAEPGEFSKRAVLNGKIDLTQAEGIVDIINSESEAALRAAKTLLLGNLRYYIEDKQSELVNMMAELNVTIEYPEDKFDVTSAEQMLIKLRALIREIYAKLETARTGAQVKYGVNVVLAGKTNVGKSSLLNALLGYERAIVTDIAGTTRDTVSEHYEYKGMLFNLVDTAGLRKSSNPVEKLGIERSIQALENADVVLWLHDGATRFNIDKLPCCWNIILVATKSDITKVKGDFDIHVSAKTGENIEKLRELIFEKSVNIEQLNYQELLTNQRHVDALNQAVQNLERAAVDAENLETPDCIAINLIYAYEKLGEITGQTGSDEMINCIFEKFCVGK